MIAEPFLLNEDCSVFVDNDTSTYDADIISAAGRHHLTDLDLNATINLLPAKTLDEAQQMTKVRYAFWIMAALMVRVEHSTAGHFTCWISLSPTLNTTYTVHAAPKNLI